ncbi:MAG: EAL domain-containing protein [Cellulosilyticaceae bacterium]
MRKIRWMVLMVFMILVGTSVSYLTTQLVQNTVMDQTERITNLLEKELEKVFEMLATIAYVEELDTTISTTEVEIQGKIDAINSKVGQQGLKKVGVVNTEGKSFEGKGETKDMSGKSFFYRAIKGESIVVADESETIFAQPFYVDGKTQGVIYGVYDKAYMEEVLVRLIYEPSTTEMLLDGNECVVLQNDQYAIQTDYTAKKHLIDEINKNKQRQGVTMQLNGQSVLVTYEPLAHTELIFVRILPVHFVFGQAYVALGIMWLALGVVIGILIKKSIEEHKAHLKKLEQLEKSQNIMVLKTDDKGKIVYSNQYMRERLGYKKEELKYKSIFDILLINDHSKIKQILSNPRERESKNSIDLNFITREYKKIYTICTIRWDMSTPVVQMEISAIDIAQYYLSDKGNEEINSLYQELASSEEEVQRRFEELCEKQEELQISEARYSLVVDTASMGIWDYDAKQDQVFVSPKLKEILGVDTLDYDFANLKERMHPDDYRIIQKANMLCLDGKRDSYEVECRVKQEDGSYFWIYIISKWLRNDQDEITRVAGSITDITSKKKHEEKVKYIAYYDDLTGMTNKNYLKEIFVKNAKANKKCAIIHLDIDNFKFINDSFGHEYGDLTLVEIAARLNALSNEDIKISRIGADEFVVLLLDTETQPQIKVFMDQLGMIFKETFMVKDIRFGLSFSAGIALYPQDGNNFEEMMTSADAAMHKAKEQGKRKSVFFDHKFKEVFLEKIHMENDLRRAIKNDEFVLFYQAQTQVATGVVKGFEALIRWMKPDGTMIPPFKFIGVAEETGLMVPIGAWVIKEACLFINRLKEAGYGHLYVAVNISVVQLTQEDFVETVEQIIEETAVDASKLHIEITETMLMECIEVNIEKINRIKQKGVIISLDDFGKGYSSLTYLKQLPINVLKIEKAFIDDIIADNKKNITGAIINLGHELALEVVAEGVEEKMQYDYLEAYKCDVIQGYYISKPIPERQVFEFLEQMKEA